MEATTCDWCSRQAPVRTIEDKLWRFWKVISTEPPDVVHKNICDSCEARHVEFSAHVERYKSNESRIATMLSFGRDERPIDVQCHPVIKEEPTTERAEVDGAQPVPTRGVVCSYCKKAFSRSYLLTKHLRLHTDRNLYRCSQCGEWFPTLFRLNEHLMMQHIGDWSFECPKCDKRFMYPFELKDHLPSHVGDKPFKCPSCSKRFANRSHLDRHFRAYPHDIMLKCSVCGKCFSEKTYLNKHLRRHDDKPFKCPKCDERFSSFSELNAHKRTHPAEKPHGCSQCDKRFPCPSALKRHERTHTAERPFECSYCEKRFVTSFNLSRHLHTIEKPFECSRCDKRFCRRSDLKKHLCTYKGTLDRPRK